MSSTPRRLPRPRTPAAVTLALTAALVTWPAHAATLAPPPPPAAPAGFAAPRTAPFSVPRPVPACAVADARVFPLTTRLRGGPAAYEAGGGYGTWHLDLTNTTARTCTDIHPVVVFVDGARALRPSQARLEFYAGGRPHPVTFETTDRDELVGAFEGFPGFTVGPRQTVSVEVRLMFTSDAVPNRVTANAAVVQRHGDDGDWVGQSNDYRFTVGTDPLPVPHPDAPDAPDASDPPEATPDAGRTPSDGAGELARTGLGAPATVFGVSTTAIGVACLITGCLAAAAVALLPGRGRR
ncbi:hypothetical protein [Streptomyces sp. bgisy159]|uniref:hypothetical protein n=1 Tax=Streptomyces sp. bgisy159 TaxID=3413795 RepID=UPI003F49DF9F